MQLEEREECTDVQDRYSRSTAVLIGTKEFIGTPLCTLRVLLLRASYRYHVTFFSTNYSMSISLLHETRLAYNALDQTNLLK